MTRVLITGQAVHTARLSAILQQQGIDVARCVAMDARLPTIVAELRPNAVILMLGHSGESAREVTKAIMTFCPAPVILATESANMDVARAAMPALQAGALSVLVIPGDSGQDVAAARQSFAASVRALSNVKVVRTWPERLRPAGGGMSDLRPARHAVAIGTSTGGPSTLHEVLRHQNGPLPAPILVVQHIARGFVGGYAAWLASATGLRVKVAEAGEPLVAGGVYIAPDDHHLGVDGDRVVLSSEAPVGGFRPAATVLFRSLAASYGAGAIGVVLTGMGSDGVEGLRAIRAAGGRVLVQNEESSIVFGMPGAAVAAGLAHETLPPDGIAQRLLQLTRPASGQTRLETLP